MTLLVQRAPNPAAGADWTVTVPGQYDWAIVSVAAQLAAGLTNPTTATDDSGNANNLTYRSSNTTLTYGVTGPFGAGGGLAVQQGALAVGGAYVAGGPNSGVYDVATFTAEAIVKPNDNLGASFQEVICIRDDAFPTGLVRWIFGILRGSPALLRVAATNADVFNLGPTFTSSAWHHVAVTYDGARWVPYVDGVAGVAVVGHPFNAAVTLEDLTLGGDRLSVQNLTGDLAACALFSGALTGVQIAANQAAIATSAAAYETAVLADAPLALWMLDDPSVQGSRTVLLRITDGTRTVALIPPPTPQADATTMSYSWVPVSQQSASSPTGSSVIVAIPPLILPPGYTIGTTTTDIQSNDQWSNIAVWADYTWSGGPGGPAVPPYRNVLLLG
jgi:hypothetical protein